jgi:hypothetical protein
MRRPKLQIASAKSQTNDKRQYGKRQTLSSAPDSFPVFGSCRLEFVSCFGAWCLVLGAWDFRIQNK